MQMFEFAVKWYATMEQEKVQARLFWYLPMNIKGVMSLMEKNNNKKNMILHQAFGSRVFFFFFNLCIYFLASVPHHPSTLMPTLICEIYRNNDTLYAVFNFLFMAEVLEFNCINHTITTAVFYIDFMPPSCNSQQEKRKKQQVTDEIWQWQSRVPKYADILTVAVWFVRADFLFKCTEAAMRAKTFLVH